jgi:hypothetical protein
MPALNKVVLEFHSNMGLPKPNSAGLARQDYQELIQKTPLPEASVESIWAFFQLASAHANVAEAGGSGTQ